jgi:fermentation-respiration switch protein FrsA (DUF1100 family)
MQMASPIALIFQHFWIAFIVITCANGLIWWRRAQPHIAKQPELADGYRRLIRGWLIFFNIPWLVMGAGILFGGVRGVFDYFDPRNGVFVLAWYASVVALWILTAVWVFLMRGAEQLIQYPGLLNLPSQNPRMIKAFFALSLIGGIVGMGMMFFTALPSR